MLLLCCSVCLSKPEFGLFGLLRNVHAYSDGETAYVPLLGIAAWAGATVEIAEPEVHVTLAGIRLKLTMGSAVCFTDAGDPLILPQPMREIGHTLCVPARFWERLGVTTEYVTPEFDNYMGDSGPMNACDKMGSRPVIVFGHEGRSATVLVHLATPDVVAKVVTDLEESGEAWNGRLRGWGKYGLDWVIRVGAITQDHFEGPVPAQLMGSGTDMYSACFADGANSCIYGVRQGKWRLLLMTDYRCPWMDGMSLIFAREEWVAAGIPMSLARLWQIRFK